MPETMTRAVGNRFYELKDGIWYLIEDEENMGQGDPHALLAIALFNMLEELLRDRPLSRIFHDIYIHWDRAKGDLCVAPDLAVFPTMEPRERRSIYLWEEASWPIVVVEVLSESTRQHDLHDKLKQYRDDLHVPDYFVCEPREGAQEVWGYRLAGGQYREIEPDEHGRVWSEQLQAWFGMDEEGMLAVWDGSGKQMSRHGVTVAERDEVRAERDAAQAERDSQRQRAEAAEHVAAEAEARARALEEELQRLRGSSAGNAESG